MLSDEACRKGRPKAPLQISGMRDNAYRNCTFTEARS